MNRSKLLLTLLGMTLAACGDDAPLEASTDGGTESDTEGTTTGDSMTSLTQTTDDTTTSQSTTSDETTSPGTTTGDGTTTDATATDATATGSTTGGDTDPGTTTGSDTDATTGDTDAGSTGGSTGDMTTGVVACLEDADCADLSGPCSTGVCNAGACEAQLTANDTPCESGDLCMTGEVCTDGVCGGGLAVDCSDFDGQCTLGVCNPLDGACAAEPANEGGACDDGQICSYGDMCMAGECLGLTTPIFEDPFADDSMGWTLEGKWEIGAAMESPAGTLSGLTDPAADHTDTADEGLAGVVIGGLSGPPGHPPQYMTSPVIDLSVLDPAADKELRFWRHLVTNVAFATETIDVWDGAAWVNVYTSPGTLDAEWTEIVIDISDYSNADFQIRFGHEVQEGIPVGPAEPSWSVDDVAVGPVCPDP